MPDAPPRWTNGAAIYQARKNAGLTVRDVAGLTGSTAAHISQLETGGCEASVRMLSLLADALNIERGPLIRSADEAVVAGELAARTRAARIESRVA